MKWHDVAEINDIIFWKLSTKRTSTFRVECLHYRQRRILDILTDDWLVAALYECCQFAVTCSRDALEKIARKWRVALEVDAAAMVHFPWWSTLPLSFHFSDDWSCPYCSFFRLVDSVAIVHRSGWSVLPLLFTFLVVDGPAHIIWLGKSNTGS